MSYMSLKEQMVYLFIHKVEALTLWMLDGRCSQEDIVECIDFVKENNLLPHDKITSQAEKMKLSADIIRMINDARITGKMPPQEQQDDIKERLNSLFNKEN